jgi:RNA recognition motif-containing protein
MNIYVSNLGSSVKSEDLKKHFATYGEVFSVNIILDKFTNRSRGFAFVDMRNTQNAEKAIRELNGMNLDGRSIRVNEAKPGEERNRKASFY